jgi:hypothetical protein
VCVFVFVGGGEAVPDVSGGRRTKIHGGPKKHITKSSKTVKTIVAHKIKVPYLSI